MWVIAAILLAVLTVLIFLFRGRSDDEIEPPAGRRARVRNESGPVIESRVVQSSIASGAPPTPWMLRREDHEAMDHIEWYFVHSVPCPDAEGRPFIQESVGTGGPQLELYVPIITIRHPVVVLAKTWDTSSQALISSLFFAGTVEGRLADIVSKLGFDYAGGSRDGTRTVYRDRKRFSRQRAS
jgi:hypothetical protein